MNSFDIIKTVRVTEKGTAQSELNKYTLVADKRATKLSGEGLTVNGEAFKPVAKATSPASKPVVKVEGKPAQ